MNFSAKTLEKLSRKKYRDSFLRDMVTGWLVRQIKVLRNDRGWSQAMLGKKAGDKPQSAIGRLESESYGNWNTNTLLELASAFDVALEIRFVSWRKFLRDTENTSPEVMSVRSFSRSEFISPRYAIGFRLGTAGLDQAPSWGVWEAAARMGRNRVLSRWQALSYADLADSSKDYSEVLSKQPSSHRHLEGLPDRKSLYAPSNLQPVLQ